MSFDHIPHDISVILNCHQTTCEYTLMERTRTHYVNIFLSKTTQLTYMPYDMFPAVSLIHVCLIENETSSNTVHAILWRVVL